MNGQRTARQTSEAKTAWSGVRRFRSSIFGFDQSPDILKFTGECIHTCSDVIVIGGGRGAVAEHFLARGKQVLNFDIAKMIPEPPIRTHYCDMEVSVPFRRVDYPSSSVAAIAPFALEYTNVPVSTRNIADVLFTGDIFVWLCHHSDSFVTRKFRIASQIRSILHETLSSARSSEISEWLELAKRLEPVIMGVFSLDQGHSLLSRSTIDLQIRAGILADLDSKGVPAAKFMLIVAALRLGHERYLRKPNVLSMIEDTVRTVDRDTTLSHVLLGYDLRTPEELGGLVDSRFRLVAHRVFFEREVPLAIIASFERV